jgi:cytochrome c oxidase assembly protein subunit 15
MARSTHNPWLHRFAVFTALATLALLGVGGVVTSKGVGMAVPDWPTSYGYNMFALPFKFWKGGAFHEHTHRLVASGVGFLTMILAGWLWVKESRAWMRWLGVIALGAVIFQGILGGLRVVWLADYMGIFHATLAQLFFSLVCAIALFTSKWWTSLSAAEDGARGAARPTLQRRLFLFATALILLQLMLGATMRHQHAGLAIPDFPLAYGKLWPATDAASIALYNQQRLEITAAHPITSLQIILQMVHRIMAVAILVAVALAWKRSRQERNTGREVFALRRISTFWFFLILAQAGLGAWTIWSNKAADIATAHVLFGALSLVTGVVGCLISFRRSPVPVMASPVNQASRGGDYRAYPAAS